jgi:N-acetyl-beta-hexosaminidase
MQSKIFPELVNNGGRNCTGPNPRPGLVNNGFYSQADIARLVEFAKRRGIRLVPEFDMPGHSGGFCHGLKSAGIKCCTNGGMGVPQIEDDPQGARCDTNERANKDITTTALFLVI